MNFDDDYFNEKIKLITRNLIEVITFDELVRKIESGNELIAYIGYEPVKRIHIGWLIWMLKLRDLEKANIKIKVLEATWHAWINDKGNFDELKEYSKNIQTIIKKFCTNVEFVDSELLINDPDYWKLFIKVAKYTSLDRVKRAIIAIGRKFDEVERDFAKIIYPIMQATDAIYLNVDFALGGVDQKRAFMIARDISLLTKRKNIVILSTPVLTGLSSVGISSEILPIDEAILMYRMSFTKPGDAIFIDDEPDVIREKISKAYCPPKITQFNPIIEIAKYIILPYFEKIEIETKYGKLEIQDKNDLDKLYCNGFIQPNELKEFVIEKLIEILKQIR